MLPRLHLLLLIALFTSVLVWQFSSAPAASAASDTFTPLFLGSLNGSASLTLAPPTVCSPRWQRKRQTASISPCTTSTAPAFAMP